VLYEVRFRDAARKHFLALDAAARRRIAPVIEKLSADPRPSGAKMLIGVRRIRVGDYRVLFSVDEDGGLVWIEDVRHRSKAYGGH
jgi:mRNA interferase RelE/StbE